MIIILCDNYNECVWAYECFLEFLQFEARERIVEERDCCCEIVTDTDLRYKFVDYRYMPALGIENADVVGLDNFLTDMSAYTFEYWEG